MTAPITWAEASAPIYWSNIGIDWDTPAKANSSSYGVTLDNVTKAAVYDYDAKGRMPYMRLELTAAANAQNESIMIHVVPH